MRKMASIRRITSLHPIPEADNIEVARVDGWDVVVKKGEFQPGDLCVYCEIDSLLPEREEFEFMRARKFRVKTIKLRGQISQGLVFPLDILPPTLDPYGGNYNYVWKDQEGLDVSEILGIIKWEPQLPAHLAGHTKGTFPGWLPKTDEERVQNMGRTLEHRHGVECYITEKLHGTSITCYLRDDVFGVCSRNQEKKDEPGCLYWETAKKEKIEEKLRKAAEITGIQNIACQGELCGPSVNKNTLKLKEHEIFLFDLFDIDKYEYFSFQEIARVTDVGFKWAPFIYFSGYKIGTHTVQELVALLDGQKSTINRDGYCEGWVFREWDGKAPSRLSFKVINNTFLLKVDKDA